MLRARPVGDNTRLMPARLARHLLRHHRTPAANLQLGGMLAWIAGAANASGFLVVHQYTSHMTGMVSSLADALALEIGWQQREAVTALLEANGWADIACRKDFGGNDRCVTAQRPK